MCMHACASASHANRNVQRIGFSWQGGAGVRMGRKNGDSHHNAAAHVRSVQSASESRPRSRRDQRGLVHVALSSVGGRVPV
jgi:hypothetical protein